MDISGKIIVMHIVECAGGVERYLYDLLKYIDHRKIENILVCSHKYTIDKVNKEIQTRCCICSF